MHISPGKPIRLTEDMFKCYIYLLYNYSVKHTNSGKMSPLVINSKIED